MHESRDGGAARALAWAAHFYTALGLVLAAIAAVLIVQGGDERLRLALLALACATAVDASDGWLARRLRVAERLPGFDGRRLDDIIDFHTYTTLPLLLIWRAELLPAAWAAWLLLPLLASAYGFAQADAKTDDGYFLGFPSYWNVVAFYAFFLRPAAAVLLAALIVLAMLTFVPVRHLYPSQPGLPNRLAAALRVPWAAMVLAVLLGLLREPRGWVVASLYFPAFYLAASWYVTLRRLRGAAAERWRARSRSRR